MKRALHRMRWSRITIWIPAAPEMVTPFVCSLAFVILAGHATSSYAAGDHIQFAQAPSRTISATLVGSVDPCHGSVIFPMGTPTVSQNGTSSTSRPRS